MSKMVHAPRLLRLAPLVLLAVLPACQTAQPPASQPAASQPPPPPPATMQMTQEQQGTIPESPKLKVKVVDVIIKDGVIQSVDRVKIKRYADIIVWATNGSSLQIKWKGKDPLPALACPGAFCGTLSPTTAEPGVYSYAVTVDGKTLDPDVEVEPGP